MEDPRLLERLERKFGLRVRAAAFLRRTPANHVIEIDCADRKLFLKLRIDAFSRGRVAEEAALLHALHGHGFKAPALVEDVFGERLFEWSHEGTPVWGYLTEEVRIETDRIDLDDDVLVRAAARRLAELHTLTDDFAADFTVVRWGARVLIDRSLAILEPLLADRNAELTEIRHGFERVKASLLRDWAKTRGVWGIIHADLHGANLVLDPDGELWLLDFESFGNGWRIHDIVYLLGEPIAFRGPLDLPRLRDRYSLFLDEYAPRAPRIGPAAELPLGWLAVCMLLQFGRRVGFQQAMDGGEAPGADVVDGFLEKVRALTQDL